MGMAGKESIGQNSWMVAFSSINRGVAIHGLDSTNNFSEAAIRNVAALHGSKKIAVPQLVLKIFERMKSQETTIDGWLNEEHSIGTSSRSKAHGARWNKARMLLASGQVKRLEGAHFSVGSQNPDNPKSYNVILLHPASCDCDDYLVHGQQCKHIFACHLYCLQPTTAEATGDQIKIYPDSQTEPDLLFFTTETEPSDAETEIEFAPININTTETEDDTVISSQNIPLTTPKKAGRPHSLLPAKKRSTPKKNLWQGRGFAAESPSPVKTQQFKKPQKVNLAKPKQKTSSSSSLEEEPLTVKQKPQLTGNAIVGKQVKVPWKNSKTKEITIWPGQISGYNHNKETYSIYFFDDDKTIHGMKFEEFTINSMYQ